MNQFELVRSLTLGVHNSAELIQFGDQHDIVALYRALAR
jgi:hypothetical protein